MGELKAHIDGLKYLKSFLKEKTGNITIFAARENPARLKSCIYCHMREGARLDCRGCHIKKVDRKGRQLYVLDALDKNMK